MTASRGSAVPRGSAELSPGPLREGSAWLPPAGRRRTLFDLSPMLHCSIIGTCLTMAELRKILVKAAGDRIQKLSDHDVHTQGVRLAALKGPASKLLNKALDTRHHVAIRQFAKAATEHDIRELWSAARREGQIEGAYWAAITHPSTSEACLQHVFGDVHMLSHLVGSSNRADVRRLLAFESEIADLKTSLNDMAGAMRSGFSRRDSEIQQLRRALASADRQGSDDAVADDVAAAQRRSLRDLRQQLDAAMLRAERQQKSAAEAKARERSLQARLDAAEERGRQLENELHALEECMRATSGQDAGREARQDRRPLSLADRTILYVGGKSGTIPNLRDLIERLGGFFLHHDGGQMQNIGLLAGFIRRADCVFFPVDCVSHQAMFAVKRHCGLSRIPFIALHRSSSGSLLRGVEQFLDTTT
jgi:hypothetical protein